MCQNFLVKVESDVIEDVQVNNESTKRGEANITIDFSSCSSGSRQPRRSEWSEPLAHDPNEGKAAFGPRVKSDKDGVIVTGDNKRRS